MSAREGGQKFDGYAQEYRALTAQSIAASGEDPTYFAEYKLTCLERLLGPQYDAPVLDYGCGIGSVTTQLVRRYSRVDGWDPSAESLAQARAAIPQARFFDRLDEAPDASYGAIVMSGVLHHVPPAARAGVLASAVAKLTPGRGRLVVFEHNPLNPLTQRAVKMCPFDDDAILLWPWEARRLLADAGLEGVRLDFIVFFPRRLALLRPLEPRLARLPIGAQMMLVATRPLAGPPRR
jgi:SAM-dependent methyltransferase